MSPSTPRRRRHRYPPFNESQTRLVEGNSLDGFQCLARTANPQLCVPLQRSQIDQAARLVSDDRILDNHKLWDIITLLTCEGHQRNHNNYWREQIDHQWRGEIPNLEINGGQRHSIYSPMSKRSSRASGSNLVQVSVSPSPRSTAASTRNPQDQSLEARPVTRDEEIPQQDHFPAEDGSVVEPTANEISSETSSATATQDMAIDETVTQATFQHRRASAFSPGELAHSPRWCVRRDVRALLFESLPSPQDKGTIYAFEDGIREMTKIGITMRDYRQRRREIEGQHGRTITSHWCLPGIPYIQLLRLEKLVHADLAHYQHDLKVPHGTGHRTHREWFAIDMPVAQRTITTWWTIMQHINLRPGTELSQNFAERLWNAEAMFDVSDFHDDGTHYSHDETLEAWKRLFQLPSETKRPKVPKQMLYLTAAALFISSTKAGLPLWDSIFVTAVVMTVALTWAK